MRGVEEYQAFPHSKEAEESVLGCIMINPELYTVVKDYIPKPDVFYHEKTKIIWQKIV